jgi:hypothetical protein
MRGSGKALSNASGETKRSGARLPSLSATAAWTIS